MEIVKSTDKGKTWTEINQGLPFAYIKGLYSKGTTLFAVSDSGISRSTDEGNTWTYANSGIPAKTPINGMTTDGTALYAYFQKK